MTSRLHRYLPLALLIGLIGSSAHAQEPASAQLTQACAAYPGVWPAEQPLSELGQRIATLQTQGDPQALALSCQGWRRAQDADALSQAQFLGLVASSLAWRNDPAQAIPLLEAAFHAFAASPQPSRAATPAGWLAMLLRQRGEGDAAVAWSEKAYGLLRKPVEGISERDRMTARINHVLFLSGARRWDGAARALDELEAELGHQSGNEADRASLKGHRAVMLARQGRLAEALAVNREEVELRKRIWPVDAMDLVSGLSNQGVILSRLGRHAESEAALREGVLTADRAIALGTPDTAAHAVSVREGLAAALTDRGALDEALAVAQEAVTLMAQRPEAGSPRGGRPLRRLADVQMARGDLAAGLGNYRKLLSRLTPSASDGSSLGVTQLSTARALIELGDLDEAQALLDAFDADPRSALANEKLSAQTLRAQLALRRQQPDAALAAWAKADELLAASVPPSHPTRQVIAALRCEWATADDCTSTNTPADDLDPDSLAQIALANSRRLLRGLHAQQADTAARQALLAASDAGQPRLQWEALDLLAQARQALGEPAQAILFGKLAIDQLQQQRTRLLPLGARADARYVADKAPLYRRVADWLVQARRLPEALEVLRLLKSHEQAQFRERADAGDGRPAFSPAEEHALARLNSWLARADSPAQRELRSLSDRQAGKGLEATDAARLQQLRQAAAAERQAQQALLDQALAALPPMAQLSAPAARASRIAPGEVHVSLLAGEDALSLLITSPRGLRVQRLPWRAAALAEQVAQWRDALQRGTAPGVQAIGLQRQLGSALEQAARTAHARRLVLALDGPLRYLPPALLSNGQGQPLGRTLELIVQSPGPATQAPGAPAALHASAFGVTRALQGLPALPGVAEELCNIVHGSVAGLEDPGSACAGRGQGPLPGNAHLNEAFTEAQLLGAAQAQPGSLLHLGTHFVLRPGNVSRSWLLMGDGQRLSLDRMRQLQLGTPRLVTLSACETAVAVASDGREVDGLAAALLDGGAREVMASLWRVDDAGTARFMRRFYAALAARQGQAAAALRQAQGESLRAGEPARVWAAFVLMRRAGS